MLRTEHTDGRTCIELLDFGLEGLHLVQSVVTAFHEGRRVPVGGLVGVEVQVGVKLLLQVYTRHRFIIIHQHTAVSLSNQ